MSAHGNADLIVDPISSPGFWTQMEVPELKTTIPYPKQFARSSEKI